VIFLDDHQFGAVDRVEDDALMTGAPLDEERAFEWNWATALVDRAMDALNAEYSSRQKARVLAELRPFLTGGVGLPTHEGAATALGVSLDTLRSHLFRLRARYRILLRAEVLRTVPREEDIDAELRYLCSVLLAGAHQ
jgi:DNA-directed RNA polymerase specialized sigma24 family protein